MYILWRNNYRFASEARLWLTSKQMELYQKVKGDALKANAHRLLTAAQKLIDNGVLQWR